MANTVRVSFHGAAGTVTGSKYLVEYEDKKILIDCGIFQGRKELRLRNWDKPSFNPKDLDCIILTHAHIDHSGYLPLVCKKGFKGPIYCSEPTKDLLHLLLPDSAHLQEQEAYYANKHKTSKHKPAKPLFDLDDAYSALLKLKTFKRDENVEVLPKIYIKSVCAGHILGSLCFNLELGGKVITFSGDLGRYDSPLLPDPKGLDLGDLLLIESTYGSREHKDSNIRDKITKIIKSAVTNDGAVIIPSFAIGRTQSLLYEIAELERKGDIPILPVYIDSPMAVDATGIYKKYKHDFDSDTKKIINSGEHPLRTERTQMCHSVGQSKGLNNEKGARIIISASGMVTGGRILHHMKNQLPDEKNIVLFVGYQGRGTRGQIIQSGAEKVKIYGKHVPIRARVETISGLSAHGDKSEMTRWIDSCNGNPNLVKVVHGEPNSSKSFSNYLEEKYKWKSSPAEHLEKIEI